MRKSFTAVALVVGMALGSVLTMALNPVGAASALTGNSTSSSTHQNILQQALSTLVGNGTITQKQSDAVTQQVQNGQAAFWAKRPPLGRQDLARVAFLLGIDAATLKTDLRSGQTIAGVATAKGINPTTLAGQITALLDKGLDARVAAHHLTAARAATMKANLPARVTAFLNRSWGRKLGPRHAAGSDKPATTTPPTTGGSPSTTTGSSSSTTTAPSSTTTAAPSGSSTTSTTAQH